MCGRLDQNDISRLILNFDWADEVFNRSQDEDKVNAAPGTYRPILHLDGEALFIDDVHWGYRSAWAEASGKIPMAINTRLDKILNRYWKPLLKGGRAIVPAKGWYEWTGEKGAKQPWHIYRTDGAPLYLAALVGHGDVESKTANGFTIVTAAADGGLLDVHDRRPIALDAADAAMWMKPDLPADEAAHILNSLAVPAEAFTWHMVDKAIGNVRNQDRHLAEPVPG
ncbi:SOS response-associated peptidase family protein [Massilia sp. DJPM01]|uniref:SOS response-associated peptidase family protein n=1 Tax=Massilia sp. DJPM01 TaxID=3024404 RepID=UPI00259D9D2D|nr:SOS response-associated peptidase family protein [Massilia sp. DJPM01]MDM5181908.1 SOS response-associated peptidase family protein [Massilia sp. DJPM01]